MPLMTIRTNVSKDKITADFLKRLSLMFETEFQKPKQFVFVNVMAVGAFAFDHLYIQEDISKFVLIDLGPADAVWRVTGPVRGGGDHLDW